MKLSQRLSLGLAVTGLIIGLAGCGSGDVDPDKVKVDSPGYYNGPMGKKGAGGAALGGDAKDKGTATPGN